MFSTKQNGYQPNPCGIENPVPPKTGSNVDFALYHKKQLIRFCKKFHKDCYRLIGQKMALKDKVAGLEQELEQEKKLNAEIKARFVKCNTCTDEMKSKCLMFSENLCEGERCEELVDLMALVSKNDLQEENEQLKQQIKKAVEIIRDLGGIVREGVTCHYLVDYGALHRATLFLKEIKENE